MLWGTQAHASCTSCDGLECCNSTLVDQADQDYCSQKGWGKAIGCYWGQEQGSDESSCNTNCSGDPNLYSPKEEQL